MNGNRFPKRNKERFPEDFMFVLTKEEISNLRSHFATSSWGGSRYTPTFNTLISPSLPSESPKALQAIIFA